MTQPRVIIHHTTTRHDASPFCCGLACAGAVLVVLAFCGCVVLYLAQ